MSVLLNLVGMTVTGAPGTGSITLNVKIPGYLNFTEAGATNGITVTYEAVDGVTRDLGTAVLNTATGVLSSRTCINSTNGNANASLSADALIYFSCAAADIVQPTATQTLTNKRITQRIGTVASSATPTPDGDANDQFNVTALAANATFAAPTGTPTDGQKLLIRIKDNGTTRTLAFNAIYRAIGITMPTATTANKTLYLGCIYNAADSKWDAVATVVEA